MSLSRPQKTRAATAARSRAYHRGTSFPTLLMVHVSFSISVDPWSRTIRKSPTSTTQRSACACVELRYERFLPGSGWIYKQDLGKQIPGPRSTMCCQCSAGERVGPGAGSASRITLLGRKVRSGKRGKSRRSIPILRYPILKQPRSARRGVSENMLATMRNLAVPEELTIYKHSAEEGDCDHDEDGNASSVGDDSMTISH